MKKAHGIFGSAHAELQLFREAQAMINSHLQTKTVLEQHQAERLFDIVTALSTASIQDAAKKSFILLLQRAANATPDPAYKSIYERLEAEFCMNCPELFDENEKALFNRAHSPQM